MTIKNRALLNKEYKILDKAIALNGLILTFPPGNEGMVISILQRLRTAIALEKEEAGKLPPDDPFFEITPYDNLIVKKIDPLRVKICFLDIKLEDLDGNPIA